MENKKRTKIVITVIVLIVILLMVAAAIFYTVNKSKPEDSINTFFTALKAGDLATAEQYLVVEGSEGIEDSLENEIGNTLNENTMSALNDENYQKELITACFSNIEWKINNINKEKDKATVTIELTSKDFSKIVPNFFSEMLSKLFATAFSGEEPDESEMLTILKDEIANTSDVTTRTLDIQMVKENELWKISTNEEDLLNLLLPGIEDGVNKIQEQIGENLGLGQPTESSDENDTEVDNSNSVA